MRYFIDTEFLDRGADEPVRMISIGIVAEDGREYYAETDVFHRRALAICLGKRPDSDIDVFISSWLADHVIPQLIHVRSSSYVVMSRGIIADEIRAFVGDDSEPEWWGWYCAYDWVLFSQLFGQTGNMAENVPPHWPKRMLDLRQWMIFTNTPKELLPKQVERETYQDAHGATFDIGPHHALADARWLRDAHRSVVPPATNCNLWIRGTHGVCVQCGRAINLSVDTWTGTVDRPACGLCLGLPSDRGTP